MSDRPEHPCKVCLKIPFSLRDYKAEPCKSCDLPRQYDEQLKKGFFPSMAFMRDSSQFTITKGNRKVEEKKEIKIKTCERCGQSKDVKKYFGRHAKTKDGYSNICSECRSNALKKTSQSDGKIELDFTNFPELHEQICKIAEERFRKPENQVMWWLVNTDFDKLNKGLAGE